MLDEIGRRTLSGAQYVGETLTKPSRALWGSLNYLTGDDAGGGLLNLIPFSDALGLTDPQKGVELSGFLEDKGVIPKNKAGFDAWDIPRLGLDIGGDPLSYLSGVGTLKALGKGGSILAKASPLAKGLSRTERMGTTVAQLAPRIAPDALEAAAKGAGFADSAAMLARHGGESVGGLLSTNLPFGGPLKAIGTGKTAQTIGGALDKVGEAARYGKIPGTQFSPGAQLARVFSPAAQGLHTPEVQKFSKDIGLWNERDLIETGVRGDIAKQVTKLHKAGALDDEASVLGRMAAEGVLDKSRLTPEALAKANLMEQVVAPISKAFRTLQTKSRELGIRLEAFGDPAGISYWPREFVDYVQNFANSMPRQDYLRGIKEGTEALRQIISDPKLAELDFDDAVRYFENTYGSALKTAPPPNVTVEPAKLVREKLGVAGGLSPESMRAATGVPTVTPGKPLALPTDLKPWQLKEEIAKRGAVKKPGAPDPTKPTVSFSKPRPMDQQKTSVVGGSIDVGDYATSGTKRQALIEQLVHRIQNVYTPEQRAVGGFGRNMLLDAQQAKIGMEWKLKRTEAMLEGLKNFAKPLRNLKGGDTRSVAEILDDAGLDATTAIERVGDVSGVTQQARTAAGAKSGQVVNAGALNKLAELMNAGRTKESLDAIANMHVPASIADDMVRLVKGDDIKQVVGPLMQLFDSATNLFKVGVLNWPARYVRDITSGQAMNVLTGNFSPSAASSMHKLLAGETVDFTHLPIVQRMLAEQGLEATAENSTDMMRQLFYTYEKHTAVAGTQGTSEIVGELSGALPGGTKAFAGEFPGFDPLNPLRPSTFNAGDPIGTLGAWKPWNVRGVGGRLKSGAKPVAIGERIGRYTDSMNRGVAFITNLEKGVDPAEASKIADALQVNYSPRNFTAAERKYLKRAFPFYSFTAKMLPTVTKQLLEHPGGGIAQSLRATNEMRGDEPLPDYLQRSLAIPLGDNPDGSKRYLTALDLMHDAPLNLLSTEGGVPSLTGTTRNVLSQMNPYPKALTELAFGKTLFQDRELSEADPTVGRLISNVSELTGFGPRESASGRAAPFISPTFEHLAANSPASRLLSSARVATDPRKYSGDIPGLGAATNLLTGARVSDVSPGAQDAVLRDALFDLMKERGAGAFETVRYSKAAIEQMEKTDPAQAEEMRQHNALVTELANRAKSRKSSKR